MVKVYDYIGYLNGTAFIKYCFQTLPFSTVVNMLGHSHIVYIWFVSLGTAST